MVTLPVLLGINLGVAAVLMTATWLVSLRMEDVSIIDIFWGVGGALIGVSSYVLTSGTPTRRMLLTAMVVAWGLRLAFHIGKRARGKGEDFRYAAMRARDPEGFPARSLVTVFLFQAFLIWLVSLPVQVGQVSPTPPRLGFLDYLGLVVFLTGFLFEAVADRQLRAFLADPDRRSGVMDQGLWRYSRHPNYFGDALLWWGIFFVAAATPSGWMTLISPVVMTFLLMNVSGVPMLEEALAERRPGYRDYMERTSAFFPWPPKKGP
jgi:steroid 5-alpha reductase family enzyme